MLEGLTTSLIGTIFSYMTNNIHNRETGMTNLERLNEIKKTATEKGLTVKWAGYTQSKRGNEDIYKVYSDDLLLKKGTIKQVKKFLSNVI